jgi:hypothetical protein
MALMEIVGAALGGGGLGGLAGLLGVALQQYGKAKDNAHALEVLKANNLQTLSLKAADDAAQLKLAQQTGAVQERLGELNNIARQTEADAGNIQASYQHDAATYTVAGMFDIKDTDGKFVRVVKALALGGIAMVDILRGFIRPLATVYALVLNSVLIWWAQDMVARSQVVMSKELTEKIFIEIVFSTTFLISTVVLWWFGSRPNTKR